MPRVCLQFVIVVFPDHNHLLFLTDLFRLQKKIRNEILNGIQLAKPKLEYKAVRVVLHKGLNATKPVISVSDKSRLQQDSSATENS